MKSNLFTHITINLVPLGAGVLLKVGLIAWRNGTQCMYLKYSSARISYAYSVTNACLLRRYNSVRRTTKEKLSRFRFQAYAKRKYDIINEIVQSMNCANAKVYHEKLINSKFL